MFYAGGVCVGGGGGGAKILRRVLSSTFSNSFLISLFTDSLFPVTVKDSCDRASLINRGLFHR